MLLGCKALVVVELLAQVGVLDAELFNDQSLFANQGGLLVLVELPAQRAIDWPDSVRDYTSSSPLHQP